MKYLHSVWLVIEGIYFVEKAKIVLYTLMKTRKIYAIPSEFSFCQNSCPNKDLRLTSPECLSSPFVQQVMGSGLTAGVHEYNEIGSKLIGRSMGLSGKRPLGPISFIFM